MAYPGKVIHAPQAGERIEFLQTAGETNGKLLEFKYYAQPGFGYLVPHVHVAFEEQYEIISGVATYMANGVELDAYPGQVICIPAGTKHVNPWNKHGTDELCLRQLVSNPLGSEIFLETLYGCIRDQRHVTKNNQLNLLQSAITVYGANTQTYSAALPAALQAFLLPAAAFVASLLGYKYYYTGY